MAPKSKANHDESKSETASVKNGHTGSNTHRSNGKMQRVNSAMGTPAKDAAAVNGTAAAAPTTGAVSQQANPPGVRFYTAHYRSLIPIQPANLRRSFQLQWSSFDRDVLHDYRREHRLDTPAAFSDSYQQWVLEQSDIGLRSPTMARKAVYRRQGKDSLAKAARKHFNGQGVQENDVIVAFLHRVRNPGVMRPKRDKNLPHSLPFP